VTDHGEGLRGDEIRALDRAYVVHSWSVQSALDPLPVVGADGARFTDADGRRYLDFASQVVNVNLGHQHPRVTAAIAEQAGRLCALGPGFAAEGRARLGRLLAQVTPGDLTSSFFTNGGADAVENAVKLARWSTGRPKIVARYRSYHGATAGAASLTGDPRRWSVEPGVPGVVRLLDPYPYRCPAGHPYDGVPPVPGRPCTHVTGPGACPVCSGGPHLEEVLRYEDPRSVAAVLLETVAGGNGVLVPPGDYLASIREVCDRHGILLILDEVMTGFGRTGRWFACEHWGVTPDIMTLAKGITSGYVPLGAVVVSARLRDWLQDHEFASGLTSTGNPVACAAGIATIETLRDEGLVERAAVLGERLGAGLTALAGRHPAVGEARGLGLLWCLELVRDGETREPFVPFAAKGEAAAPMRRLKEAAMARGLYLMTHDSFVLVAPPLVIGEDELDEGLALLDETLTVADDLVAQA